MVDITILQKFYVPFHRKLFPLYAWDSELIADKKQRGKQPVHAGWQNTLPTTPDNFRPQMFNGQEAGMVLEPTDLVVDVDVRNGKKGLESLQSLNAATGLDLESLAAVKVCTGSGGLHLFFKKPPELSIPKKIKEYPDIDFLGITPGQGKFVVTAGSRHSSGGEYEFTFDSGTWADLTDAPKELLSVIGKVRGQRETFAADVHSYDNSDANIKQAIQYCRKTAEPAVEGKNGDDTTYKVVCQMCDYGLHPKKTLEIMFEHYNNRCQPPWSLEELKQKIYNAYNYHRYERGSKSVEKMFPDAVSPEKIDTSPRPLVIQLAPKEQEEIVGQDWMNDLRRNERGGIKPQEFMNALLYLKNDPDTRGALAKNLFTNRINKIRPLPWEYREFENMDLKYPPEGVPWTETDLVHLRAFFNRRYRFDCSLEKYMEVINVVASDNSSHPVREYIKQLKWDGVPRVETVLQKYAGAVGDDGYLKEVSRIFLCAAVKRAFLPGCKYDYVMVLEGVQGMGKSMFIRALAGHDDWFTDRLPKDEREAAIKMQGKWFVELGELATITPKDVDTLKAFITSQNDECRLPYGRMTQSLPRQCIFIGTTNNTSYLRDETGERRFLPVTVKKISLDQLRADRDQIFAEAYHMVQHQDAPLYIKDKRILKVANETQRLRTVTDPWIQIIQPFLDGRNPNKIKYHTVDVMLIWEQAFNRMGSTITPLDNMRILRCLTALQWSKKLVNSAGVGRIEFTRPEEAEYDFL